MLKKLNNLNIEKYIPFYKDVKFTLGRLKWPTQEEASRKAWIVAVIMIAVGLTGFFTHIIMNLL